MTKEQAERLKAKIEMLADAGVEMTEKEADVLGRVLNSDPMVKALAIIVHDAMGVRDRLVYADLGTPAGINEAARMQGLVLGAQHTIAALLNLSTEDEKDEEDDSQNEEGK